jgi:hypothetical protein
MMSVNDCNKKQFYRRHDQVERSRARKQGQIGAKATLEIKERKIIVIFMTRCLFIVVRFPPIENDMQH